MQSTKSEPMVTTTKVLPAMRAKTVEGFEKAAKVTGAAKAKTIAIVADRTTQVTAASAATGAAALGTAGAVSGLFLGGVAGSALGLIPALFTFGLSIPFGAMVGGTCGFVAGGAAGCTAGGACAGAVGYGAYTRREKIQANLKELLTFTHTKARKAKAAVIAQCSVVKSFVAEHLALARNSCQSYAKQAKTEALEMIKQVKGKATTLASDPTAQVTAASATVGAMACGTGAAGVGFVAGGLLGGAVGLVPAIFTFGLSIPIGFAIGSSCGLATGAAVGGVGGLVGGGMAGYGTYTRRAAIKGGVDAAVTKVSTCKDYVKCRFVAATGGTD
mmetsp:Transcript_52728/g.123312  ORF Transcript_52728/g.123312 Transcript_52728/m.123312 type:complete len:330 (-) Transcript_52728:300-1289(-)